MNNEEINEVLTSFISNNSGGELVQLLKEHPKLSTDEGLQELRELCEIQGNTGHRFSLLWLLDLLESSSEIGVETAVEDYELKTTLAEELGSILVFVLPVYRDSQQAEADSFLNNIEFLLGILQRELLSNDAIISRYPALSLIQHYLEVSDEELSDFIDKHPELFSKDVLALIGLLKIVASEPKVENHIRRRRRLLRKYKAEGKVEALGKYHGLSFVPEGTYEFYDFFWHHIQEAHEGGHLITKELSPTVMVAPQ